MAPDYDSGTSAVTVNNINVLQNITLPPIKSLFAIAGGTSDPGVLSPLLTSRCRRVIAATNGSGVRR